MRKIHIFDTTLRDGEQSPGATLTKEQKIKIAHQLAKLGVDAIEPGFPISSPGDFEAVQTISRQIQDVEICGFARCVKADIDAAVKATADAAKRRLHLFVSSSDIHLNFQLKKSRDQVIELARRMVAYGKQFAERIEFSPMDATRSGEEFVMELVEAVIAEGATIINIPDTMGYALPEEYGNLFTKVRNQVRGGDTVEYSCHVHNDLGLAVANSIAAIRAGVSYVEVTVNGIGERAGNTSLEELVMAIETRKQTLGIETNVNIAEIYNTSRMVSRAMHFPIAFNKPVVGRNAFRHESGIHQDGLLKNRNTYEIMDPEQMGIPRQMIVLGKHSGRHAIKHRVEQFGVTLSDAQLEDVYERFIAKADEQKIVTDGELAEMAGAAEGMAIDAFELVDLQVMSGSERSRVASVTVRNRRAGESSAYTAIGKGPIEAVIRSIKQALPFEAEFIDLELHSVASGEAAGGEAEVAIKADNVIYGGSGADEDILLAVAKAFISACNQAARDYYATMSEKAADCEA